MSCNTPGARHAPRVPAVAHRDRGHRHKVRQAVEPGRLMAPAAARTHRHAARLGTLPEPWATLAACRPAARPRRRRAAGGSARAGRQRAPRRAPTPCARSKRAPLAAWRGAACSPPGRLGPPTPEPGRRVGAHIRARRAGPAGVRARVPARAGGTAAVLVAVQVDYLRLVQLVAGWVRGGQRRGRARRQQRAQRRRLPRALTGPRALRRPREPHRLAAAAQSGDLHAFHCGAPRNQGALLLGTTMWPCIWRMSKVEMGN